MEEAGDIVRIAAPFTLGVWCSAAAGPVQGAGAALCLLSGALLCACVLCRRFSLLLITLLFLILGMFCHQNALAAGPALTIPRRCIAIMDSFAEYVSSVPFGDRRTSDLLTALLTGRRKWLDSATIGSFRTAGAAHILALSGLHLGVLAGLARRLLMILGNSRPAAILRSALIVAASGIYALMCGCGASILRAFFFISLREIASHHHGRRTSGVNVLCAACLLHLVLDPLAVSTLSFQLSYLSVAALIVLNPRINSWFGSLQRAVRSKSGARRSPVAGWIWNSLSVSLSCQCFTAPLVYFRFGTFPRFFLLTNLIALPLTELFLPLGLVCAALHATGVEVPFLYRACDFLCRVLTESIRTIASM